MLFTEPGFLFFFLPLTLGLYYVLPRRLRNLVLVICSIFFYAWGETRFLPFLAASVALNYYLAILIERDRGRPAARLWLSLGIVSDLALLAVFKYAGFVVSNLNMLNIASFPVPSISLPLGISFFTFHKISYKVDVYRGVAEAKRSPVQLILYILFFPQLIAGPIVRYNEISDQLGIREERLDDFALGVRRFIVGMSKKMLIANSVALAVDRIFELPAAELGVAVAWAGALCYAIQLYFDFSGYSDMAIGLARMFGFRFPENFDHPYISASITEFWRRWHITLSRFFRDYLYIPIGGNRVSPARTYANLMLVFFLCGLWHGASWNFVVWGLWHGLFLVLERVHATGRWLTALSRPLQHAYTLLVVLFGWVLFRSPNLSYATAYMGSMLALHPIAPLYTHPELFLDRAAALAFVVGVVAAVQSRAWLAAMSRAWRLDSLVLATRTVTLIGMFYLSALKVASDAYNPFIYFRF